MYMDTGEGNYDGHPTWGSLLLGCAVVGNLLLAVGQAAYFIFARGTLCQ